MDWPELFIVVCVAYSVISWFTKIIKFISTHFTDIGEDAFRGCTAITSITLSDGIEFVQNGAFSSLKQCFEGLIT